MMPIKKIAGRGLPLLIDDIDTDRIIPARFLRSITFEGLGENLFIDERKTPSFPLNSPFYKEAQIILAGNNFGCGSSREHAPQAIKRAGFKAVIAESFAEIFFGNSLAIGLLCVCLPKAAIQKIAGLVERKPKTEIRIDIVNKEIENDLDVWGFDIPESARQALIKGSYDLLPELLENIGKAREIGAKLPY